VQALASDAVVVTGTVADVRPFLQFAAVVVAPMRVARGLQNKVLEAMAMGRPVVCARDCAVAISAADGNELLAAETAAEYINACQKLLAESDTANAIGRAGRACVVGRFSWDAHLSRVDQYLAASPPGGGEQQPRRDHVAV
jgi:glycosyltransferase involved in cell wall biosynthesis